MTVTVTPRETAPCTAGSPGLVFERETAPEEPGTLHPAMTESDRRPFDTAAWLAKFKDDFTPPKLLTERRPAVDTMALYARRGRYTDSLSGFWRALGIAWCRGVAIPGLVCARTWEWLTERPARFIVVGLTVKALSFLPPVAWTVDHVIHPGVDLTLRVFL